MNLKVKILNDKARAYYNGHGHFHDGDAGLDLYVLEDTLIKSNQTVLIKLGIACESVENKAYYLIPRSSISKTPLRMSNSIGLIDAGYRGEIMASCDNIKDFDYTIKSGQRLFQIVACDASPISYQLTNDLTETTRSSGGFGSTGK